MKACEEFVEFLCNYIQGGSRCYIFFDRRVREDPRFVDFSRFGYLQELDCINRSLCKKLKVKSIDDIPIFVSRYMSYDSDIIINCVAEAEKLELERGVHFMVVRRNSPIPHHTIDSLDSLHEVLRWVDNNVELLSSRSKIEDEECARQWMLYVGEEHENL